jgi:hypothetical protein
MSQKAKIIPLAEIYSKLYRQGNEALKQHDPCKWSNGQCAAGTHGCCQECKHLSPQGCTVEALWCKVWLCHAVRANPVNARIVTTLDTIHNTARTLGVPLGIRASKEESLR